MPPQRREGDLVEAYHHLLHDPDPEVHEPAAIARIENHYFVASPDS
ncbi:hypothetical protein [Amycolatopsis antarctica]|nr:hypothetical protein [Amycolatopsis antarctica]